MREIKFRVWNGTAMENKIMAGFLGAAYVQGIHPLDSASMSEFNTIYAKGTPVMQYTGLKDKNGKEIYEGDIVRVFHRREDEEESSVTVGVVEYSPAEFYINGNGHSITCHFHYNDEDREVIGNYCMLKNAPFRTDDETLVAAAGSCAACPKRSGNNVDLFNDVAGEDTCTDKPCYDSKVQAQIDRVKEEIAAKGVKPVLISTAPSYEKKPKGSVGRDDYEFCGKSEPGAVQAVVVAGSDLGKKKYVKLKEKEPDAPKAPKVSDEEREAERNHRTNVNHEMIKQIFEIIKLRQSPTNSFLEHLIDVLDLEYEVISAAETVDIDPKVLTDLQGLSLLVILKSVEDNYGGTISDKTVKFWKKETGVDVKAIQKRMDKEFEAQKKQIVAERQEEPQAFATSSGKARNSKLKKDNLKLNT